jgi:MraZ protein
MFRGNSLHTLDDKGRFIIPSRFREVIRSGGGDTLVLTRLEKAVVGYTLNAWNKLEERILTMADATGQMRDLRRYVVGGAHECNFDKNGRVLVPPILRKYAGLEKDIVLVGLLDHFEIWSVDNWDNHTEMIEANIQKGDVYTEIAKLGL